jgi:signal transduction histidine kinase
VISTLLIAAGAALSGIISRGLTRPLTRLTAATAGVGRGEEGAASRVAHGGDEIGRLAASFSRMAAEVADARRELERRVDEAQASATALERANDRLQQAIRDAEHARREAEGANRAKSDFLAVMSHELRTPLNAIGGYTQLLELGIYGPVSDAQRDTLARITRNQTHLLRLINDVLNFAKIDAGQVEYTIGGVPLDDALADVEALVAPQMRAKRIAFSYTPPAASVVVRADRERLQQIVLNLLANAVKFTAPGGTVAVACDEDADVARVRVRDSGVGIPGERLRSIFDPFVQGDRALNRPNEGVGLGLAISRDLARGMGGELTVESVVGVGSTFTVTLPRAGVEAHGGTRVVGGGARALTGRG